MNFLKTSEEGGGGHFRSEKFRCAFSVKKRGGVAAPRKISLQKAQHCFPKIGWGGQRPFGRFPKIHRIWSPLTSTEIFGIDSDV